MEKFANDTISGEGIKSFGKKSGCFQEVTAQVWRYSKLPTQDLKIDIFKSRGERDSDLLDLENFRKSWIIAKSTFTSLE